MGGCAEVAQWKNRGLVWFRVVRGYFAELDLSHRGLDDYREKTSSLHEVAP